MPKKKLHKSGNLRIKTGMFIKPKKRSTITPFHIFIVVFFILIIIGMYVSYLNRQVINPYTSRGNSVTIYTSN